MSCRGLMPNEWRRQRRRRRYRPIISCWPPTPWCPPVVEFCLKPEDAATVRACLTLLSGRRHRVLTAIVLTEPNGRSTRRLVESVVTFNRLTTIQIDRYLASRRGRGQGRRICDQRARGQFYSFSVRQLLGGCRAAAVRDGAVAARSWLAGAVSVSIRVATSPGEAQVAVVEGRRLRDFCLWRPGAPDGVGDVHRGRVIASVPAMAGAFVALADAEGFLPDSQGGQGTDGGDDVDGSCHPGGAGEQGSPADRGGRSRSEGPVGLVRRGPDPVRRLAARYPTAAVVVDDAGDGGCTAGGRLRRRRSSMRMWRRRSRRWRGRSLNCRRGDAVDLANPGTGGDRRRCWRHAGGTAAARGGEPGGAAGAGGSDQVAEFVGRDRRRLGGAFGAQAGGIGTGFRDGAGG